MGFDKQDAKELIALMEQRQKIDREIRDFKHSGKYQQIVHELVERAPGYVTINWTMIRRHNIFG